MAGQRLAQRQGESIRQVTTIQGTKSIIEFLPLLRTIGLCVNREEGEREKKRETGGKSFNGKNSEWRNGWRSAEITTSCYSLDQPYLGNRDGVCGPLSVKWNSLTEAGEGRVAENGDRK